MLHAAFRLLGHRSSGGTMFVMAGYLTLAGHEGSVAAFESNGVSPQCKSCSENVPVTLAESSDLGSFLTLPPSRYPFQS